MWWSFNQWVVVIGLVVAFVTAATPMAVELVRRYKDKALVPAGELRIVEIEERFLDHLTEEIEDAEKEIIALKQEIVGHRNDKARLYRERDAARHALLMNGIPIPETE